MMNCIAVDDEPLALKLLQDNISKVSFLNPVALCSDAFESIKILQENKIDLIFIDIQMPGLSGLQFIGSLENKPLVIFITAYKQYALDSYDLAVVDYLVKPVSLERFIKACNRAKEMHELKALKHQQAATSPVNDFMFVNVDYCQVKLMFIDIIWIEGLRDYSKFHLRANMKPLVVRASLKSIEFELPRHKFIRVHKSYIVSVDSLTAVRKNSVFIKDMELPVGESYREEIDKLVKNNSIE
ncbi:MAG TPA: response regulator transcription factor [Puia sp.]